MTAPDDMFLARHYARVRRPVADAHMPPAWCYGDQAFHGRELERIFGTAWCLVGHVDRVPAPGDYMTIEYAGRPLIVVRGRDGIVRAFANSCRHRGSRVAEGNGACRAFKCPYHGWVYGLDGALEGAPDMEETRGFEKRNHGLVPVRIETWGGLMFLNFDPEAAPLARWLGDLVATLAPYKLDRLALARERTYGVACNWKVYVENFMDYYHTPTVHQDSLASGSLKVYHRAPPKPEPGTGSYMAMYLAHEGSAALLPGMGGLAPMFWLAPPMREARGSTFACIFPCALLGSTIDCVWYVMINPKAVDRIELTVGSCFPREEVERPGFAERALPYYQRWDVSVDEDNRVNELQQRGLASPLAAPGRLSVLETMSHIFRNWVLDRVIGEAR